MEDILQWTKKVKDFVCMKKLCLVMVGHLKEYPPVLTFLQVAKNAGYDITVVAAGNNSNIEKYPGYDFSGIKSVDVIGSYESNISVINKMTRLFAIRRRLWSILDSDELRDHFLIVVSEITVKHLGERITTRNYMLYQLELIERYQYIPKKNILTLNTKMIGNTAKSVIVCEYNRAHITKAWWELKKLPLIIKNKPYVPGLDINNLPVEVARVVNEIRNKAAGRKIILYQGIIGAERPVELFVRAFANCPDEFLFVVMGNREPPIYDEEKLSNYMFVPFIAPPYHLAVTQIAYVGVVVYLPGKSASYSDLNTVYCAPNKIWEYAKFGVPIISNDLPGLEIEFSKHNIGRCAASFEKMDILNALRIIEDDYEDISQNSYAFYESYDVKKEIEMILKKI